MIHRSTIGCLERVFGFLIERYAGAFPTWLSPTQVTVIPVSEKFTDYARRVFNDLKKEDVRVSIDASSETLSKRIRNAKMMKTPYLLIVGQQEVEGGTVTVESRDRGQQKDLKLDAFIKKIGGEIKNRE